MPAAAELAGSRTAPSALALLLSVLFVATACTTATGPMAAPPTSGNAALVQSVRTVVDAFNSTAGGSTTAQQKELHLLVSSGQAIEQDRCPISTSTIELEPVYGRLAAAPGWEPVGGTFPGAVYALPTLIRIYTGSRITGTDLTDLHLAVDAGRVRFPALCLS